MELTEEDFIAAMASQEALAEAVTVKPQGWYSLFYREKDQLLARIRQTQASEPRTSNRKGSSDQVNALAAEYARVEKINDLIAQTTALRDTAPKVHQTFADNKAQRVLGGEAPRALHTARQEQQRAHLTRRDSSANERERERLANELAEGRRVVEQNLRRLVENGNRSPGPRARSRSTGENMSPAPRPRSRTMESSPKGVTFDVPGSRSSGVSHASGGSQASGISQTSVSSYTSESDQSSKARRMLGIGRKSNGQHDAPRPAWSEKPKRVPDQEDPLVRLWNPGPRPSGGH